MSAEKNLKYFMRKLEDESTTFIQAPASFHDADGNPIMMEIRMLPQKRIDDIYNKYTRRTLVKDRRGNPVVNGNQAVYSVERDNITAAKRIVVEALVYPKLDDRELMEYYGCVDVTEMPVNVFSRPGEYAEVLQNVFAALGLSQSSDDKADEDAAKN